MFSSFTEWTNANSSDDDANATRVQCQYVKIYMHVLKYNDDGLASMVVVMSYASLPK